MVSPAEKQRDESSLIGAVVDVLDAGQRVVLDRIELAVVETRLGARNALASFALVLTGLALLLVGWIATNAVGILLLERYLTRAQAVGVTVPVNFALGGLALLLARGRAAAASDRGHVAPSGRRNGVAAGGTIT